MKFAKLVRPMFIVVAFTSLMIGSLPQVSQAKPKQQRDPDIKITTPRHGTPSSTCRSSFVPVNSALCFTGAKSPDSYANAEATCRLLRARVTDYGDWRSVALSGGSAPILGGGSKPPVGIWLGPITADDQAIFVNSTDSGNFDGETSRFDKRSYHCVHDR